MLKKILIVEDEPLMLKFLEFRLIKDGYDVLAANDGKEAEEYIYNESFSLIIVDLMIPFVSGFELLAKIKATGPNTGTPVLIISAYTQENVVTESVLLGANDFLPKPFDIDFLLKKVNTLLHKYEIAAS